MKWQQSKFLLLGRDRWQVDVILHRREWFNLTSCPASLPLPQAARRTNPKPAVAASFANDAFVVVDVWYTSYRNYACLQYLGTSRMATLKWHDDGFWQNKRYLNRGNLTWTCCLEGSWTIAVPFTFRSKTPLVPENQTFNSTCEHKHIFLSNLLPAVLQFIIITVLCLLNIKVDSLIYRE